MAMVIEMLQRFINKICLNRLNFIIFARIYQDLSWNLHINTYLGITMCKRATAGTYLNVNALPVNAQPIIPLFHITVGHFHF